VLVARNHLPSNLVRLLPERASAALKTRQLLSIQPWQGGIPPAALGELRATPETIWSLAARSGSGIRIQALRGKLFRQHAARTRTLAPTPWRY
jgi:hypothetical protein